MHPYIVVLVLVGCDDPETTPSLPGDDVVLARVGDSEITRYDFDRATESSLGPLVNGLDEEGRGEIVEGLVATRAMAQLREREMTPEERAALDREVATHREHLLVRQYLARHAPPEGADADAVRAYYEANRERFTPRPTRRYELLVATRALTQTERDAVSTALRDVGDQRDWSALASSLSQRGLPFAHQTGDERDARLEGELDRALRALDPGRSSPVLFVSGRAFVLRVTDLEHGAPRPLAEVQGEIRAALGARSTRDAVRSIRERAVAQVEVEYAAAPSAHPRTP
jgi:hypothetical protein